MKKFLLPGALVLAGLLFIGMSFFNFGKDALTVKISNASYVMPSVYKVYANPEALNGEYYFFKMLMTNNGNASMQDVKVSYDIPGYIDWTELQTIPVIYPGQHVVIRCYPHFKDDVVKKMTQSQETGEIKIEYNGGKTKKESFTFNMMGRNQFVYTDIPADEVTSYPDMMHNTQLLPCLVTPEDPIVKYYTSQVQDKFMQGEAASVENDPQKAMQGAKDFLVKLYAATVASRMVYSGTEGIPQKMGDISSTVQSARLPREVVTGNTGLCIELSLLYASVLKAAGLHPVIFLIPGHAFPGVLVNNYYFAIEATGVGGQGLGGTMTPEQAFEKGSQELATFIDGYQKGDTRNIVIDINDLEAKGVIPMELSDDEFLRKKVDDIAATFGGGGTAHTTVVVNNEHREGNSGHKTNNSGSGMRSYSGQISFSYPAGWQRSGNYPVPQVNTLVTRIVTPDQTAGISVWDIPASSPDQALYMLKNQLAALGQYITYQKVNQANGYSMYQGSTSYNGGTFRWEGVFRSGGDGVVGLTMGGVNFAGYQGVFNSIITTIR
ncbi:hypothetical protein [Mucilaginibacter sp.]|jgi:hypothetical protein|uniref:hypothetical protein n=1 Tax=Mucilaginibacter sp. TaxID=1882438 RepID=UPI002D05A1C6|nr:hypothetical protein [Mucilaginibacter sp.]HTI58682.1 hypothetical protein [Mucilaginibacter sp.]